MIYIVISIVLLAIAIGIQFIDKEEFGGPKYSRQFFGGVFVLVFAIITFFNSWTVVNPGDTAVPVLFGKVDLNTTYNEGPHLVNPIAEIETFNTKLRTIEFSGDDSITAPSADRVQLTVNANITYRTNPEFIGVVLQELGDKHIKRVVIPAVGKAIRNASKQYDWADAVVTKRTEFAQTIQEEFKKALKDTLISNGIDENIAGLIYSVGSVQLQKVVPPKKIQNSIDERLAAEELLKKQEALRAIAEEEAKRRLEEGKGINNLLNAALGNKKGEKYDPRAVEIVLNAIASKTKADAMAQAIESDKVSLMVMDGANPSVNVK